MQTMPRLYRWTREEYDHLIELGAFAGAHVELIGGKILEMSPKGPRHAALTNQVRKVMERAFPADRFTVRIQDPLALSKWDEPEPDVAIVGGKDGDYLTAHPTAEQTALVVEVAETSVAFDLGDKADMYAAAGITDYWVVNIGAGVVVVCRAARPDAASPTGVRFGERREYRAGDQITPLAGDAQAVSVADLLP
jgi:Uma2 family endonuclease